MPTMIGSALDSPPESDSWLHDAVTNPRVTSKSNRILDVTVMHGMVAGLASEQMPPDR